MANSWFQFKHFRINQDHCAMKVTTDACILGAWAPVPTEGIFLDIGSGTGLLSLMIAQRSRGIIEAVEFDTESFLQSKENAEESIWRSRVHVIHADIRSYSPGRMYDFIICNPPFFFRHLKSSSARKNVARHTDHLSLHELVNVVSRLLKKPDGRFAVLLPGDFTEILCEEAAQQNLFPIQQLLIRDNPSAPVMRAIHVFSFDRKSSMEKELLTIKTGNGTYSDRFIEWMKPFYLNL